MVRPSAFWERFLKEDGENGSAGPPGNRAVEMSRLRNSSSWSWSVEGRMGEDLVVKKEKRLARPGLGVTGVALETGGMVANGSGFSLVGEGKRPRLMGVDSP